MNTEYVLKLFYCFIFCSVFFFVIFMVVPALRARVGTLILSILSLSLSLYFTSRVSGFLRYIHFSKSNLLVVFLLLMFFAILFASLLTILSEQFSMLGRLSDVFRGVQIAQQQMSEGAPQGSVLEAFGFVVFGFAFFATGFYQIVLKQFLDFLNWLILAFEEGNLITNLKYSIFEPESLKKIFIFISNYAGFAIKAVLISSAPVLATVIVLDLSSTLISKLTPRFNSFFEFLPIKAFLGFLAFAFSGAFFSTLYLDEFSNVLLDLMSLLGK